ncbi:MAG: UPF0182 family protein [Syntrophomonadaceae bacterium]|nr:UPF0182 family protein [Syntrophomonadaceae bacterium]
MEYRNSPWFKIALLIIFLGFFSTIAGYYVDWLWFKSLALQSVFSTTLLNSIGLVTLVFILSGLFIWFNLHLTNRHKSSEPVAEEIPPEGEGRVFRSPDLLEWLKLIQGANTKWAFIVLSIVGAYMVSGALGDKWLTVQQFFNRVLFGIADPVFGMDIGFYFFNLSFYRFVYGILMGLLVLTLVLVGGIYFLKASTDFILDWDTPSFAKNHMAALLAAIFVLKAWDYRLKSFDILFSSHGVIYGATYADIFARLLAYKVLIFMALLLAVLIGANFYTKKFRWIIYGIGAWLVVAIIMGGIYPFVIQKFVVQPNEFNKEKPYIEAGIKFTQMAYELDEVDEREFKIDYKLNLDAIKDNHETINNIRLWDWEPLLDTYKSLQELRPYYVFNDVDIDRYVIDGRYRQVMLAAREMEQENLSSQAKTWINQRLMFTHGYGVVMSPVTEIAQEGFPLFFMKDIPPQFATDIKISRPEIYFGERTDTYVIVSTNQQEFDYPMGEINMYTTYQGDNGIKIQSWPRRLMLSWVLQDYKMLFSSDITNSSQVLMNRNILDRVKKIAPYLGYDADPYLVISSDGRLFWMMDGYTYSDRYPYSQPYDRNGNNYVRNAVKVVCDAYSGQMVFYVADSADPLIQTYQKIFPELYKPISEMPEDIRKHVRYPEDLLSIQADIYRSYHMSDPGVFYNKEDQWIIPSELIAGQEQQIDPYYIIMRLPGETDAEYILMLPYTPSGRPNMIAWMCARMDGLNYGKKLVFRFPKQETVYGPMQIESRINQDTEISRQLTLWNQKGSQVRRGNLVIIPINNSILYIEPLYLQAEASQMPELKRIIAAYGNKVVMEETLDKALTSIFGTGQTGVVPTAPSAPAGTGIQQLTQQARQYYDQAMESLKSGDWTGYGENLEKLNNAIKDLEALTR